MVESLTDFFTFLKTHLKNMTNGLNWLGKVGIIESGLNVPDRKSVV